MAGNRQLIQQNRKKRAYTKLAYRLYLPIMAAAVQLGGCSLAVPEAGSEVGGDRLIGAFITQEYLDLYDTPDGIFFSGSCQAADWQNTVVAYGSGRLPNEAFCICAKK